MSSDNPELLYFWPAPVGGIAEYTVCQVTALQNAGIEVQTLCSPQFANNVNVQNCNPVLWEPPTWSFRRPRQLAFAATILRNMRRLATEIQVKKPKAVLCATLPLFLSPFWANKFRFLKEAGITFATMLHDPTLDYVVGGVKLHEASIKRTFGIVDHVFAHHDVNLTEFGILDPIPKLTVVPHGPYLSKFENQNRQQLRKQLDIRDDEIVLLSFGHLRDNKNLGLIIQALKSLNNEGISSIKLLVAGSEPAGQRLSALDYQVMARSLGVADQCIWKIGFIADQDVAPMFAVSDIVMLTYASSFSSASGVLNVASGFAKPVLASGGSGNLLDCVARYDLGAVVAPDDTKAIARGIKSMLSLPDCTHGWKRYTDENTWAENAARVIQALGLTSAR